MTAIDQPRNGAIQQRSPMPTSVVDLSDFEQVWKFAKMMSNTSLVPSGYRNKPEDIVVAIQFGLELGLAPMQALQSVASINGKPSLYGDGGRALLLAHPECEDIAEEITGEGADRVAHCTIHRRGMSPVHRTFSALDAKTAGLLSKSGPWSQYPNRMLQWRAFWFAARDSFADALRGLGGAEEYFGVQSGEANAAPPATTALGAVRQQVAARKIEVEGGKSADDAPPEEPARTPAQKEMDETIERDQDQLVSEREDALVVIREAMKAAKIPAELVKAAVTRATGGTKLASLKAMPDLSLADLVAVAEVMGRWPGYRADWIVQVLELGPEAAQEEFSGAVQRDLGGLDELTLADMPAIEDAFAKDLAAVGA